MARRLPEVDVVLVGFGWTASIIAQELTEQGLQVLALERGAFRDTVPDFSPAPPCSPRKVAIDNSCTHITIRLSPRNFLGYIEQ